jgi:hypothetical protein
MTQCQRGRDEVRHRPQPQLLPLPEEHDDSGGSGKEAAIEHEAAFPYLKDIGGMSDVKAPIERNIGKACADHARYHRVQHEVQDRVLGDILPFRGPDKVVQRGEKPQCYQKSVGTYGKRAE